MFCEEFMFGRTLYTAFEKSADSFWPCPLSENAVLNIHVVEMPVQ